MTTLEIVLTGMTIAEFLLGLPIWRAFMKARDAVKEQGELKKNVVDNVSVINKELAKLKEELHKRINEVIREQDKLRSLISEQAMTIGKEMAEDRLAFTEILGKLNNTLTEVKGAINNFDQNRVLEREYWREQFARLNRELDEHKQATKEELKELRK